jgi:hypothetical protein
MFVNQGLLSDSGTTTTARFVCASGASFTAVCTALLRVNTRVRELHFHFWMSAPPMGEIAALARQLPALRELCVSGNLLSSHLLETVEFSTLLAATDIAVRVSLLWPPRLAAPAVFSAAALSARAARAGVRCKIERFPGRISVSLRPLVVDSQLAMLDACLPPLSLSLEHNADEALDDDAAFDALIASAEQRLALV